MAGKARLGRSGKTLDSLGQCKARVLRLSFARNDSFLNSRVIARDAVGWLGASGRPSMRSVWLIGSRCRRYPPTVTSTELPEYQEVII